MATWIRTFTRAGGYRAGETGSEAGHSLAFTSAARSARVTGPLRPRLRACLRRASSASALRTSHMRARMFGVGLSLTVVSPYAHKRREVAVSGWHTVASGA